MSSTTGGISNLFTTSGYQPPEKASSNLDKNGFLKLLTAQMSNQDPSASQDPTQYFQTISQMSVVEQLTNLAQQSVDQLHEQRVSSAQTLLGRTVTYLGTDGSPITGTVDRIDLSGTDPRITVGGADGIDPAALKEIR